MQRGEVTRQQESDPLQASREAAELVSSRSSGTHGGSNPGSTECSD